MDINFFEQGFNISQNGNIILEHSSDDPLLFLGVGEEEIDMYRGNFNIKDYLVERIPLINYKYSMENNRILINFEDKIELKINYDENELDIEFNLLEENFNRLWTRIPSTKDEKCYGCGEQMSYLNLKGRNFPIWTSEPGVGRDKTTYVTWRSDVENKAGGDYYNSNFPLPTFISSKYYSFHAESTAYIDFNFKNENFHEICFWDVPKKIRIFTGNDYKEIISDLSNYFGRSYKLPEWAVKGSIIGVQGGTEKVFEIIEKVLEFETDISGIWCQDWEGIRNTSFGQRLEWNWKWDEKLYPNLDKKILEYRERNIKFLGYINPYLVEGTELYKEGLDNGYYAKSLNNEEYLVDFGEFNCGIVDFTNPEAFNWYKEIIKNNLIGFGLDGWMADFGEYLPIDLKLYNDNSPMLEHNHWPSLWAKCNYEAIIETNRTDILYFMRAGGIGTQKYCPLIWAGDQSVDFSEHDGLETTITGALSVGICGCGISHSDIGGYTSLFGNTRTKELFLRWAEMAVFTPVMRTHEGNRPSENFQFYEDEDTIEKFSRLTRIHTELYPYINSVLEEYYSTGIPVQRAMILECENDKNVEDIQSQYFLGKDLLVAPVFREDKSSWEVYIPEGIWVDIWSDLEFTKAGYYTVKANLGYPPVFYRKESTFKNIFENIKNKFK